MVDSTTQPALHGHLDFPHPYARFSDAMRVVGWAFSDDGRPVKIRCTLDGVEVAVIPTGGIRGDVADVYGLDAAAASGYEGAFDRSLVGPADQYVLRVEAFVDAGSGGNAGSGGDGSPIRSSLVKTLGEFTIEWAPGNVGHRERGDYRTVWDGVARSNDEARISVAGYTDQDEWVRTGIEGAELLIRECAIAPTDVVMEIGCGAGRLAHHLSTHCARWIGGDVSVNMLRHAADELAGVDNVAFMALNGSDLRDVADASLDVVYSTVVFMHLDEWDRYRYVQEMFRALKPGGRVFYDNYNLLSDEGWTFFLEQCAHEPINRPANISRSSTPQELRAYAERAGFTGIRILPGQLFVSIVATKPER